MGTQRSTACPGCQCDPSAASKEEGNKPEQIPALQPEGRDHCHWQLCLQKLSLQCSTCIFGPFFPPQSSMRTTTYSIRKESTTKSSADLQERAGLSSERHPYKTQISIPNSSMESGLWHSGHTRCFLTLLRQRKLPHFLPRSWTRDGGGGLARGRGPQERPGELQKRDALQLSINPSHFVCSKRHPRVPNRPKSHNIHTPLALLP